MANGLYRCGQIKDLKMRRLFWIICVGPNGIVSFYKREVTRPIEEKVDEMAKAEIGITWPGTNECW